MRTILLPHQTENYKNNNFLYHKDLQDKYNSELLDNYISLYDVLESIFTNINKIQKDYNNTRVLEFITDKVVDLKSMVNYIINTTYIV